MSRSCPLCRRQYADAVFFCGEDGTVTIQDQDPRDADPRLGARLGDYIVVARVADGAMGRVFEGRHPDTKARVAIKVLHAHVARDPIAVERFKREYETASEMSHRHVVKVLELGRTPDRSHFLTMEYLEGEELGKLLSRGKPVDLARVVRIVSQTALALENAHSFGFIHRDLKPDNIFLCATEEGDDVRVLDFGSVKLQMEMGAKLTAIGTTVGSPYYMSPEQAMGRADVDQRTDVFALGAILYECLTGKVAFEAPNIAKILMRIMQDEPPPPSSVEPSAPRALDGVVAKALAKDKLARFGAARELADALLDALGLDGGIERWAHVPESVLREALAAATARPRPEPAARVEPATPAVPVPPVRDEDETLPRREVGGAWSTGGSSTMPPPLPRTFSPRMLGIAAVVVIVVAVVIAMAL